VNPIVVIARGNLHLTKKAVASFLAQDIPVEVLLINNASTDSTAAWMATLGSRVMQIHFRDQKSVAECWNYGISWCFKQGAEYVLAANNDVELRPDTYRLLVENEGLFVTASEVFDRAEMGRVDVLEQGPHPDFSCFLVRRECWDQFRGFDEGMKIAYVEDCDAHVRLHRLGIPAVSIFVPFYHAKSSTVKLADPQESERICKQAELNRERFYAKYGERIGTPGYDNLFKAETFGIDVPFKAAKL